MPPALPCEGSALIRTGLQRLAVLGAANRATTATAGPLRRSSAQGRAKRCSSVGLKRITSPTSNEGRKPSVTSGKV